MKRLNSDFVYLEDMYNDDYYPKFLVDKVKSCIAEVVEFLEKEEYEDSTILVSTHGACLCALLNVIKDSTIDQFWAGGLHKNCGLSIVEIKDGKAEILKEAIVLYPENK